jgi:hypothetical protein
VWPAGGQSWSVFGVELALDGLEPAALEGGDRQARPALGGADHGAVDLVRI